MPLTLDDLIFSGPIAQIFIEYLIDEVQHGGATILQYCKSLLHCLEWVKAQKKMIFGEWYSFYAKLSLWMSLKQL